MSDPAHSFPVDALLEHRTFLRALARGLLGDADRADDAVQDAYHSALAHPPRIESAPGTGPHRAATRSWLATVVRNHAKNMLRGETRRADRERLVARVESAQDDVADRLRVQRRVMRAVEALREPYRTVVFLRFAEGLPPREIARRTGVPVETVRSQTQRGLALLRRDLDREFGERDGWCAALAPFAAIRAPAVPVAAWLALVAALVALPIGVTLATRERADPLAALPRIGPWIVARADVAPAVDGSRVAGASTRVALGAADPAPADNARTDSAASALTRVRCVDARGAALAGVRLGASEPTDAGGWSETIARDAPAFDAASGAVLRVLERATFPDGSIDLVLDVPATFELDADPGELAGAELTLANPDGIVAAGSHAHAGARPFVRFAHVPARTLLERDGGASWILAAVSADGARSASARVHAVRGASTEPVALHFEDAASVELAVASASGAPLEDVRVESDARVQAGEEPGRWLLRAAGSARLEAIVRARGHAPQHVAFATAPDPRLPIDVRLAPRAGCALDVAVESASLRPGVRFELDVRNESAPLESRTARLISAGDGRAATSLDDLAPGTYVVTPRDDGPWSFDPPSARVVVPAPSIRFVRRDAETPRAIVVRARDAEGRPLALVRCALLVDRYELGKRAAIAAQPSIAAREVRHGDSIPGALLSGQRCWWLVEADGCTSVHGDEGDLRRVGEHFELDVRLEPSWRCELWFAGRDQGGVPTPVAGVRVTTRAGRELASSLADGRVVLDLPYDPGQLRVERDGWRVTAWEGFANGRRRALLPVHRVLLDREP